MKAVAINGSPRKTWNTATLLKKALQGCRAQGAETEIVHLYDHRYEGCKSCFSCKKLGGRSYGRCGQNDELTPILERVAGADVLLLGSPLYFHTETGAMRSFMERLLFPYLTYTPNNASIFPHPIPTGLIYTMGVTEEQMPAFHQDSSVAASREIMTRIFGGCEVLLCTDTYQFSDYSKYLSTLWDPEAKARRREEVFPQDCERAYALGKGLAGGCRAGAAALSSSGVKLTDR
jgi:multimeric flavodoxin WrbA